MKKYICDLCGEEIEGYPYKLLIAVFHYSIGDGTRYVEKHLHESCKEIVISGWNIEKSWEEFRQERMKKELGEE